MDENKIEIEYEKNEYLYKILYLIRINLPSIEFIYIIMFFLKYIGLVLFSISLNKWNNDRNIRANTDKNNDTISSLSFSSPDGFHSILSKFLINGNSLKILIKKYEYICILGFCVLVAYILCLFFGFFYIRSKYYNKKSISSLEKKIKKVNKNSNFEKNFFAALSYILFLIVFFHQYIIEYYFFGFLGYFLDLFSVFDTNFFDKENLEYSTYITEHFKNLSINSITMIIINIFSIIFVLIFFIFFMVINSTKTLFINNGIPLYGNSKFLAIKIIFYNLNPFYGLINSFNNDIKIKASLILISIFFVLILIDILLYFYDFSFYPNNLNYICLFIEFFILFANITEVILFLTKSQINTSTFYLFKLFIELLNSIIFSVFFIYKKNVNCKNLFTNNLFDSNIKDINQNDIYYYIKTYLKYSKDKKNNYIKIFSIFQNHILSCDKKECPCSSLLSKSISFPINNNNKNSKDDEPKKNDIELIKSHIFQNNNTRIIENYNNSKQKLSIRGSQKNLILLLNEDNKLNNYLKTKNTREIGEIINKKDTNILFSFPSKSKRDSKEKNKTLSNKENENNNESNLNDKISKLKDEEFQMIGEQEIINRLNYLYKRKNYSLLESYIFIHLQYLIKIKQNYRLALYYIRKYSLSDLKLCFLSRYMLYEIKKYICKSIFQLNNLKILQDPYIIKYKEENIFMKNLSNFFSHIYMVKHLLIISCEKIIYFYKFRKELHNPLALQKYTKTKIYPIINAAKEIKISISKLKHLVKKIFIDEKHPIQSIELSYLLTNFFVLLEGKIPQDILQYISPILNIKETDYKRLINEFHNFLMSNPLIINLTNSDSFDIVYFTNIFLDKLNYTYTDLKNKDFHEKLFPGEQDLCKEHSFILKQFLFFHKNSYAKEKTFLKSKEGYLISINFTCKLFPNFKEDFSLIANIAFNENLAENNKKYNIKKNDDKNMNSFSFFLNHDFYILGLTKNFYLEYYLNQNMFRELRINFCRFFGIDENKLIIQIQKEIKKIIRKYKNINHKIPLKEANKAFTIFQNIKIENTFKLRDGKLLENYLYPTIFFYDKIDKKKLIQSIPEIINIIDEIGLDYDWYLRLKHFKEKLIHNNNNYFKIRNDSVIGNLEYEKLHFLEQRYSTVIENNINSNYYNSSQFFEVVYSIKKLGSFSYYIVKIHEILSNDNLDQTQLTNACKTLNKRNSLLVNKKTIQKMNSRNSIKLTKTTSYNQTDFFAEEDKENFYVNKILNNNSIEYQQPTVEKTSKKDIIFNFNNNNAIQKDIKNNNIIKEKTKKEKANKKVKIKINREDDEDENSPLVSKGKLNVILIKNNKINNILIIMIYSLILIAMILIIFKIVFSLNGFKESNNILTAAISLEMLKVDIYIEAIFSIIYCVYENDKSIEKEKAIIEKEKIHSNASRKLQDILNHLKIMQDQVKVILNNKFSNNIFKTIEEGFLIRTLNNDWNFNKRKVDILNEMRRLSYILYNLTLTNEKCNITFFYEFADNGLQKFENKTVDNSNDIQQIFFYILDNIIKYQNMYRKLSEQCIITLEKMWNNYQIILSYFLYSILVILIIVIIIYIIKFCFDYYYYKLLLLFFYDIEDDHLKFKNKIYYFHKTILEFNRENINNFEYIKHNNESIELNEDIKRNNTNNIKKDIYLHSNYVEKFDKKQFKKRNSMISRNIFSNNNNNLAYQQNNLNGSILNGSINGSSLLFLSNSNKNLAFSKNMGVNNNNVEKKEKEIQKDFEEDSMDFLIKVSYKIVPNYLKITLALIVLSITSYILLCFLNITEIYNQRKKWYQSINLLMNILEGVPRLIEMVLYTSINVITNNLNDNEKSRINNRHSNYLEFFKANSLYYSEDMMNKYFNNSFFGELLKDNLRINYNLENYLISNDIFVNTMKWQALLNMPGYFCIYIQIGGLLYSQQYNSLYDFLKIVDKMALTCIEDNESINESGVRNEITYILQEIINKYIDFITYKDSNITLEQARKNFFNSKEIKRIFNEQYSFDLHFNFIIKIVIIDFSKFRKSIEEMQNVYSTLLILVNIGIFISLILTISKGEKYKQLFFYISEIPNTNIIN